MKATSTGANTQYILCDTIAHCVFASPSSSYIIAKDWMYPAAAASSEEGYDAFRFLLSACLLGWANGKYQVARLGPSACVEFCKTNVAPMLIFVWASAKAGAWDTPVWGMFTAAYIYFGYIA